MEYYPIESNTKADEITLRNTFKGTTIILPAVSHANIGQLALDLIISNHLSPKDTKPVTNDLTLHLIGHLFTTTIPPFAGGSAYRSLNTLCLNLQVYQDTAHKITVIQQRTSAIKGRAKAFVKELMQWAKSCEISSICTVAGTDNMLRHDHQMHVPRLRPISLGFSIEMADKYPVNLAFLQQYPEINEQAMDKEIDWMGTFRGTGVTKFIAKECQLMEIPFTALVLPVAEGNNVLDAMILADYIAMYLKISNDNEKNGQRRWNLPSSWEQLFGKQPDISLY